MLDLETLSSRNSAGILSIGAVRMDLVNFALGPEFYVAILPSSSQNFGLHIDADTIVWWMRQNPLAQKVFSDPRAVPLDLALADFGNFLQGEIVSGLWGNGATFDNVILRNAYAACDIKCPWSYRDDVCFRTMRKLFNMPLPLEAATGVAHNALDDARRQAASLLAVMQRLRSAEKTLEEAQNTISRMIADGV